MPSKDTLFRRLQHLDDASTGERRAARQKRQLQNGGEILQTFLAYRLVDAAEKMALGIAIGDRLLLRHEPDNQWDPNAVKVFWQDQWIGYIPKDMAALIASEVPEAISGLEAVVTGLTTTSLRDAFRLQISIPIEQASRRLKDLGVNSSFAWDFDRTSGSDKMRLVVNGTETAFRELQELLRSSYDVSKCGYSYYPTQDGRHYPWYLSLTDGTGRSPADETSVEQQIRTLFGIASETTRQKERAKRLEQLEKQQTEISQRLASSRADEGRLRRELESNRKQLEKKVAHADGQQDQARQQAERLNLELSITRQELDLALKENESLALSNEELGNSFAQQQEDLEFFYQCSDAGVYGLEGGAQVPLALGDGSPLEAQERLLNGIQDLAATLRPRKVLELVDSLCPGSFVLLDSALKSADEVAGFEYGDRLFGLLWKLATTYRQARLDGQPDIAGIQVFGPSSFAARESDGIEKNGAARRARTFNYQGKEILMWQHLKIGVKDSPNRTLRIHFYWLAETGRVLIGHCGKHLPVPGN